MSALAKYQEEKKALEGEVKILQNRPSIQDSANKLVDSIGKVPDPMDHEENVWKQDFSNPICPCILM
jgi:hypothetical protein